MGSWSGLWLHKNDLWIENLDATSLNLEDLADFSKTLNDLLEEFPKMRRKLHEELSLSAKLEVNRAISASGLNDSQGHIQRWQVRHVGNGGGYAAVRPEDFSTGQNSPGAITRFLEGGHKTRPRDPAKKNHRSKTISVNGYDFYENAREAFEPKAIRIAKNFEAKLAERFEK